MSRPRANEPARRNHTPLSRTRPPTQAASPGRQADRTGPGPVPQEDQANDHLGREQDEPVSPPASPGRDASRGGAERATVARSLRLAGGISAGERAGLVDRLSALDAQLARYPAGAVELELSVKARGARGQRLTLECWIAGRPRLVAMSDERGLGAAVMRVREGLRRQLDDAATRREPRNNRRLRRSRVGFDEAAGGDTPDRGEPSLSDDAESPPAWEPRRRPAGTTFPGPL
jgi:hypothetical protein